MSRELKHLKKYTSPLRYLSLICSFNAFLSLFLFLTGSYNMFLESLELLFLRLCMYLSILGFTFELSRLFINKKLIKKLSIKIYLIFNIILTFVSMMLISLMKYNLFFY